MKKLLADQHGISLHRVHERRLRSAQPPLGDELAALGPVVLAVDELGHQRHAAVEDHEVVDAKDRRVVEAREQPPFVAQTLQ